MQSVVNYLNNCLLMNHFSHIDDALGLMYLSNHIYVCRVHLIQKMLQLLRMRVSPKQLPTTHMILPWDSISMTGMSVAHLLNSLDISVITFISIL